MNGIGIAMSRKIQTVRPLYQYRRVKNLCQILNLLLTLYTIFFHYFILMESIIIKNKITILLEVYLGDTKNIRFVLKKKMDKPKASQIFGVNSIFFVSPSCHPIYQTFVVTSHESKWCTKHACNANTEKTLLLCDTSLRGIGYAL